MNESYLFRGKRSDNLRKNWVTGHYVSVPRHMIVLEELQQNGSWYCFDVDPSTIGRCTGLTAAKSYRGESEADRLIFESDILQWQRADIKNPEILRGTVKWRFDQWHVIYDFECDRYWVLSAVVDRGCEIIGTIHDNPDLLEAQ